MVGLVAVSVFVGGWALFWPESFFSSFPGGGRAWTAGLGPYNEHLVRDVGAFNMLLAALFTWAAVTLDRRLTVAVCMTSLIFSVPHLIFHLFNLSSFSASDAIGQTVALSLAVVVPPVVVTLTRARA